MRATKRVSVTVMLDASEQFRFKTQTGEIRVRTITFHPHDFDFNANGYYAAFCVGTAIKKDGTPALFDRRDNIEFRFIPMYVLDRVRETLAEGDSVSDEGWLHMLRTHPQEPVVQEGSRD
jgi:hypothetical protein